MNDKLPTTERIKRTPKSEKAKKRLKTVSADNSEPPVSPAAKKDESMRDKMILLIIDTLLIGGFLTLVGQQFTSLRKFEDVKFEKAQFECLNENCDTARQRFLVFRLGENPIENVSFELKITNPDYQIIDGTQSVNQFDKSLFPSEGKNVDGNEIDYQEPEELNRANSYGFRLNQLSPNWIYELKYDLKTTGDKSFRRYGIFQIEDEKGNRYNHQNRNFYDYLRLYLTEALIGSIIFAVILWAFIWFIGKYYLTRRRGDFK